MQTRAVVAKNSLVDKEHKNMQRLLREKWWCACGCASVCVDVTRKYQRMRAYTEIQKGYTLYPAEVVTCIEIFIK